MYKWIVEHHQVLSVLASLGSVVIWLVYAQLLYLGFRRQRSPRLIINRGRNKDINALCLISNMSAESVFIEYIIAELDIGTFCELVQRLARDEGILMAGDVPQGSLEFHRLTLRLIGIYGPENMPVGAERSFDLKLSGSYFGLRPASWDTKQLASIWQRRRLRKTVEKLNATDFSSSSSFRHADR